MTKANLIRTILVEDNHIVREELYMLFQSYPNIDLVGLAADGEEALLLVQKVQPMVIVMDINLPRRDGIAATRQIKMKYPQIAVIGLTVLPEECIVYAMLKAGAFDVLAKENAFTHLYPTIQRAVASVRPILVLEGDESNCEIGEETNCETEPAPTHTDIGEALLVERDKKPIKSE